MPPHAKAFRIYYGDGSVYEGDPFSAPPVNVQCIKTTAPDGRDRYICKDCYTWRDEDIGWIGTDDPGMWDYLMTWQGPVKVLFGRTLHDDQYQQIMRRAMREPL